MFNGGVSYESSTPHKSGRGWEEEEYTIFNRTLELVEPEWLAVVFGRQDARIEKDHDDDEPIERLRLDRLPTDLATATVPLL